MAKLLLLFVICVGLLPVAVQAQENKIGRAHV